MAQFAVGTIAVGDKGVAAGLGHQHIRKIFRAHGRLLHLHPVFAHDRGHHFARKQGLGFGVDGGRVIARKLKGAFGAESGGGVLGHIAHARLNFVQHFHGEGAHRAL